MLARFWRKVDKRGGSWGCWGCWGWLGCKSDGYGQFSVTSRILIPAHRIAFMLKCGAIPQGLYVCHRCDNRACVNPQHLFLGTHQENLIDRDEKGRQAKGESHGCSKLKTEDIIKIRALYANGMPSRNLAKLFKVSQMQVQRIVARKSWRHVL